MKPPMNVKRKIKFGPFQRSHVYHPDGTRFMGRWAIGKLWLHVFDRPDKDPWLHDHEWDFWTLPLHSYIEEYLNNGEIKVQTVPAWRITKRSAEHAHRIIGSVSGKWPVVTLCWKGPVRRRWGFWRRLSREWHWADAVQPHVTLESKP